MKGRDLGFSPALWRSRWLHPTTLFTVVVGYIGPPQHGLDSPSTPQEIPGGVPPQEWTQTPVVVFSPISKDPGGSVGSAYAPPARKFVPGPPSTGWASGTVMPSTRRASHISCSRKSGTDIVFVSEARTLLGL
ncbi:hypothetical protein P4O66_002921 [Electrophorus voltai]|uniref:Uncharacterized protein n=1 Tax=Electrophorus voltai TaxID=2609070 RepID=A0AAD8YUI7_9TELE|nr:hypothetical protein P4O66_002921 [Electrophorus voltai]